MLSAFRSLADQRANKHPVQVSFSLDVSSYLDDSRRDAYPRKNFEQRGRFHRKRKFPLETRLALAALRSKTRDLILETFLARFLAQFACEIRRDKTSFFETRFYHFYKKKREKGIKCARLSNSRNSRLYFSVIFCESSKLR